MESQGGNCLFVIIDYRLKGWISVRFAVCLTSGRSAQKIRFLIFKIVKPAETLATPTYLQRRNNLGVNDHQKK
jgi:hypothetical protein